MFLRINAQKRSEVPKQRSKENYYLKAGKKNSNYYVKFKK